MPHTYESRKALLIGINKYEKAALYTCENDAGRMSELLATHEDGSRNFDVRLVFNLTCAQLRIEIERWLDSKRAPDHALLYFSGHGYVEGSTNGYLVGKDFGSKDMGVSMEWLAEKIRVSNISEITIILDCCYAGIYGKVQTEGRSVASLPQNVTLLAGVTEEDVAASRPEYGKFTEILIEGLEGAAADPVGHVTTTSLYSLASDRLTSWQQRPVFKSYVTTVKPLRQCLVKGSAPQKSDSDRSSGTSVLFQGKVEAGRDVIGNKTTYKK